MGTIAALFAGDWALTQLRLSWMAPIAGAVLAGPACEALFEARADEA